MKARTILLLFAAMPLYSLAQPVIHNNEFYVYGNIINMVKCDTAGLTVGGSGASQTWDYSGLTSTGPYVMTIAHDTSSAFPTANTLITLPGGTKQHVSENSTDTYIKGIESGGLTAFYSNLDFSRRPFTYLDSLTDTFAMNIPATGTHSYGSIKIIADAYGTLMLPGGTHTNVLRVRRTQYEIDTTGSTYAINSVTSYLWFDTVSTAPLLRVDYTAGSLMSDRTIMYLSSITDAGVNPVAAADRYFTANITDDRLYINGLETGKDYNLLICDMAGASLFNADFAAPQTSSQFEIGRSLAAGMYIVKLQEKMGSYRAYVKTVKL